MPKREDFLSPILETRERGRPVRLHDDGYLLDYPVPTPSKGRPVSSPRQWTSLRHDIMHVRHCVDEIGLCMTHTQ